MKIKKNTSMLMHPLSPFLGAEQRQNYSVSWIIFAHVNDDTWKYASRNMCAQPEAALIMQAGKKKKKEKYWWGGGA